MSKTPTKTEKAAPSQPRHDSGATLERLETVARRCFLQNGYQETTIRDIAEAAQVSPAAIYNYFKNKDDLFRSLNIPEALDLHPEYDRTRAEVMRAALFLFGSRGFQKTSMKDVADTAHISKATLYKFCESKEDLLAQVLQESAFNMAARDIQTRQITDNWRENIKAFGRTYLQITREPDRVALLRCVVSESHNLPEVGRLYYEQGFLAACQDIAAYLRKLVDSGRLKMREGSDLLTAVHTYFGSLQSFILMSSVVPSENFRVEAERYLDLTTAVFLDGMFTEE